MPDGSIVLMGGFDGGIKNDVWRSTDNGVTWTPQTGSAGWSARYGHSSVAMPDGSIVLMGGYDGGGYKNDVWRFTAAGSSAQHTVHTYTTQGSYQVALQAYNANGYTSTQKSGYITVGSGVVPDTTPPVFDGLGTAIAGNGQVLLLWNAATDTSTPITYSIYQAGTAGGENFGAAPTFTTMSETYTVQSLTNGRAYYFVVRATDSIGNQDTNTVEKRVTPLGGGYDPIGHYDTNGTPGIQKDEMITALNDFLFTTPPTISKADFVTVLNAFLFHP
jgi:hypothetical protein